ncbi:hypothetical protein [Psychrobacter urativorans]|uniref:hypothetical protein n=1 Tax=Psychrobacter urativorans TaxID=45610 RepID=UPI00191AC4F9|nr:hypothetical protein [Psychrobacter urativorans]
MANGYVENVEKWKTLTDIDYFTYFIKAWISFNAWYKNQYVGINSDREAINKIKNESNSIRNKAIGLLGSENEQATLFKASFASLHKSLMELAVHNGGERLYFEKFMCEVDRSNLIQSFRNNKIEYFVKIEMTRNDFGSILVTIKNSNNLTILNYTSRTYDINDFSRKSAYLSLSSKQKEQITHAFNEANPFKYESLLTNDIDNCLEIGLYKFIDDKEKVFKCLIEIIYGLRNALFHGEIVPNKDHRKVYEHAYHVLKILLDSLD